MWHQPLAQKSKQKKTILFVFSKITNLTDNCICLSNNSLYYDMNIKKTSMTRNFEIFILAVSSGVLPGQTSRRFFARSFLHIFLYLHWSTFFDILTQTFPSDF